MRIVMVRYKVKPERVTEHEALIADVFKELAQTSPAGFRYNAYKQLDGVSFVHVARVEGDSSVLQNVAAFKAFTAGVTERCDEAPVSLDYTELAAYASS